MKQIMRLSQIATLVIGVLTFVIASSFQTVLELILHAYSFMVAGLFIPTLGAFFWKKSDSVAALIAMIAGGSLTLVLIFFSTSQAFGLDASFLWNRDLGLVFCPALPFAGREGAKRGQVLWIKLKKSIARLSSTARRTIASI